MDSQSNFGIGSDLPKQLVDMRKRLIPKMVQARKMENEQPLAERNFINSLLMA